MYTIKMISFVIFIIGISTIISVSNVAGFSTHPRTTVDAVELSAYDGRRSRIRQIR